MRHLTLLGALCLLGFEAATAQIPPRRTVTVAVASTTSRIVVSTPVTEGSVPAEVGLEFGTTLRARVGRLTAGRYQVVTRETLNGVLKQSGYEADAPLSTAAARAVGTQLRAALVLHVILAEARPGQLVATATLGPPDAAREAVRVEQEAGQGIDAFAAAVVKALEAELR